MAQSTCEEKNFSWYLGMLMDLVELSQVIFLPDTSSPLYSGGGLNFILSNI